MDKPVPKMGHEWNWRQRCIHCGTLKTDHEQNPDECPFNEKGVESDAAVGRAVTRRNSGWT